MSIIIKLRNLTQINCDTIVNFANSFGNMGGGIASAIKRLGCVSHRKTAEKIEKISK